jgi:hypothetical protein
VFGVSDDIREAPRADREDLCSYVGGIAECVQPGTSLATEHEVTGSQFLFPVFIPKHRATGHDEEHLFGAVVHVHPATRRVGSELIQRCSHPRVVGSPEDPVATSFFGVVAVPWCSSEQVLTGHFRGTSEVVAAARGAPERL